MYVLSMNNATALYVYVVARCALFTIILFVWSLYDTVTEETSKSPSGRHGNRVEILDVSYDI